MSNSVLILSFAEGPLDGMGAELFAPRPGMAEDFLFSMIAKEEKMEGKGLAIHLAPGFCAMPRKDGYAIFACSGEYHVSEPLLVFPHGTVLRAEGDHEFECHHRSLPIN